jgi:hypothetical protein
MAVITERLIAGLPAATQRNLIVRNLERVAITIQQDQSLRILNISRLD